MADKSLAQEAIEQAETTASATAATGLSDRVERIFHWAASSKLRMMLAGTLFLAFFGGVFTTWSYLAHLAIDEKDQNTLARALAALDVNDFEKAKNIVGEMQRQGTDAEDFGGALYVLGVVKSAQADLEWSKDRQQAMHLIAARYLQKARELGVPARLEDLALFQVGQSLILGNQPQAGIQVLQAALDVKSLPTTKIHALLAAAYQSIPVPNLSAALQHNRAELKDPTLDPRRRGVASITQADILGQLGQLEEAQEILRTSSKTRMEVSGGSESSNNPPVLGGNEAQQARILSISGRLAILQAEPLPQGSAQRKTLATQARADLREALRLDMRSSDLTRQAMYWIGKSYELLGDHAAAIQEYDTLSKSFGDTAECIAAMLAKADLAHAAGDDQVALASYRALLSTVGDPVTYRNHLLPLPDLQKRMLIAHNDFIEKEQFSEAMALVDALQPVFSLMEATELRATTHGKWAVANLTEAAQVPFREAEKIFAKGRYHHRAAGAAYELLSELRIASRRFTEDLWQAAENYFLGQSYSHAERMLTAYLYHEARDKQASALLRLGQAQLALGKNDAAIDTLSECIEMHPGDAVIYQTRLECANAHLQLGQGKRAQKLLLSNLVGGSLEPAASEWRDSLFLFGQYLHDSEQYDEAIEKLDEAVRRYPDAPQALFARYTIARSYHSASKKPALLAHEAKTENERQKNRKWRDQNLLNALEYYLQVQRMLTLQGHIESHKFERALLRNCYMMQGSVLFQLKRYEEARKSYANISTLYQNEPSVLESFVHIANCYRRLNKPVKAKGTIEQAKLVLGRLPKGIDFKIATNFSRQSWEFLLNEMSAW